MPRLSALSELVCGNGYTPGCWEAISAIISAIATTAAVIVALWLANRERRTRHLERIESEARAAEIVSQILAGPIKIFPSIIKKIRERNGILIDLPGKEGIYGIQDCKLIIEREAFIHQLPTSVLGLGEFVVALARKWCQEVEFRFQIQRNPELREKTNWREHEFVCSLGDLFYNSAVDLRDQCHIIRAKYQRTSMPLIKKVLHCIHKKPGSKE